LITKDELVEEQEMNKESISEVKRLSNELLLLIEKYEAKTQTALAEPQAKRSRLRASGYKIFCAGRRP
jgi:hypothetical protein